MIDSTPLFAILQKYDFSSKSQQERPAFRLRPVVCDTAKVRFFKQITTWNPVFHFQSSCLRYCKSTIFQANHNKIRSDIQTQDVVCDTAKVRFFKQITTHLLAMVTDVMLFAILQKYDFSSKSQQPYKALKHKARCLRYCKSTIFQANHNMLFRIASIACCLRYCKSTIFQANHNSVPTNWPLLLLFAILQKYDFSSKSQLEPIQKFKDRVVCDTAKVRFFKQITTA